MVMLAWPVNLNTLFLGRLRPSKKVNQYSVPILSPVSDNKGNVRTSTKDFSHTNQASFKPQQRENLNGMNYSAMKPHLYESLGRPLILVKKFFLRK